MNWETEIRNEEVTVSIPLISLEHFLTSPAGAV